MTTKDITYIIFIATVLAVAFIDLRHAEEYRTQARHDHEKIVEVLNLLIAENHDIKGELKKLKKCPRSE